MSRYGAIAHNGHTVAYGLDHALGWFYQEFDHSSRLVVDEDCMFTPGFGRGKLIARLEQTDAPQGHLMNIAMDLDPGEGR